MALACLKCVLNVDFPPLNPTTQMVLISNTCNLTMKMLSLLTLPQWDQDYFKASNHLLQGPSLLPQAPSPLLQALTILIRHHLPKVLMVLHLLPLKAPIPLMPR